MRTESQALVDLDDLRLIDLASDGDLEAFDVLVARFGPRLHGYARRMLSDECAVQEVVQDSFVAAWRGLRAFRRDSSVQTWLFAICSRKITDAYRKRSPVPIGDDIDDHTATSTLGLPFSSVSGVAFVDALEASLATLPPRQRAAWLLREVEGMAYREIGDVLTLGPGAARGHYTRARGALRESMRSWL